MASSIACKIPHYILFYIIQKSLERIRNTLIISLSRGNQIPVQF